CSTLTSELADAELFGHAKGAFTGAARSRNGLFREANGGTLLLDEVGELDLALQAKLLRVLQEGEVRPIGEDRTFTVDVRIIAATHQDLPKLIESGRFREDLYYRLKVVTLSVPPLRERPDDIPLLARHFLTRYGERFGLSAVRAPKQLFDRLLDYHWPGNVRELENAIEAIVALSEDGELDLSLLPGASPRPPTVPDSAETETRAPFTPGLSLKQRVEAYERGLIVSALEFAGGNRQKAAQQLKVSRATLHDKLHRYRIVTSNDNSTN
ncbi:MAG TPA: sigma-54 dependent transcriptional regulator, partial [Polyangiaceae bacterium]|nr:sigma-54 dependent transcriptional regulator [Polyangiaceae bacterium]